MAKIVLKGVSPFDGEYELDTEKPYTGHELQLIKKVAGVRLNEIEDAARSADYDLFVALAVIALWRNGKVAKADALSAADVVLAAEAGSIQFVDDAEVDASPPEKEQDAKDERGESSTSSSLVSNESLDGHRETTPISTGSRS